MSERIYVPTTTALGQEVGYSRAIRIGNRVEVAGTAAIGDDGKPIGKDDILRRNLYWQR